MKLKQPEIRFLDECLLVDNNILVISDLHLGYEEHIFEKALVPRVQLKEIVKRLDKVFKLLDKDKIKIKKIIILGDLKHEFGGISDSEWRDTLEFLDYLIKKCKDIILIKGNHDNILGPIARKKEIKLKNYYKTRGICFMHGDVDWKGCKDEKILIIGHLHPAISLKDEYKKEKFKCFLKGKWKRKLVYIVPSLSPISFGYDLSGIKVMHNDGRGFVIVNNNYLKNFEVIIYNNKENKIHNFGKLKGLI